MTKHANFVCLSQARLEKAVHAIGLLSNLSSANYEYSEDEARHIVTSLQSAVDTVAAAFNMKPEPEPDLIKVGPRLGDVVNHLEDNQPDQAYAVLIEIMGS